MATIVNARDLLLQATSPRVESAYMADNIVVLPDQVEGLGLIISGTKTIRLSADTQVFQIPKSGSVSPSNVTLTVVKQNLTNAPVLSIMSGTVSPTPSFSGDTVTIDYADFASDVVTFRATVTQDSVTYTDDITVIKVREGEDSLNAFLTNESHSVTSDNSGNVLSYAGASGSFKVYKGINDVTSACTFALATGGNPQGLAYTINTGGDYAVTGGFSSGDDAATITFKATLGSNVLTKVFTLSKSKGGAVGQRGSRTWYTSLSGATAVYDEALATSLASADGGPILRDVVTQYNESVGFSETRYWDGTDWLIVNAVVDGNLLVTGSIGADALAANSVTAGKIDVTNLEAISANMGNLSVDETITIASTGEIVSNDFVSGTAGVRIGGDGTAELNNVTVRGTVYATSGEFSGDLVVGSSPAISGTTMTGSGAVINADGTFALGDAATNVTFNGTQTTINGELVFADNIAPGAVSITKLARGASLPDYVRTYRGSTTPLVPYSVWEPLELDSSAILNSLGATDYDAYRTLLPSGTYFYELSVPAKNESSDTNDAVYTSILLNPPGTTSGYTVLSQAGVNVVGDWQTATIFGVGRFTVASDTYISVGVTTTDDYPDVRIMARSGYCTSILRIWRDEGI